MTRVAAEELHKMNYAVSECNFIYYPQVNGYLFVLSIMYLYTGVALSNA